MPRKHQSKGGYALMTTLLFSSLLVVMVSALFLAVREKLFQSQTYHDQTAAFFLAESAVVAGMVELEKDPEWASSRRGQTLPNLPGRYDLFFAGAPSPEFRSVNNVRGDNGDSYRGKNSVPPGHCLLVATAHVGRASRTVEALVKVGGGLLPLDRPVLVEGKVLLEGDVEVEGVKSLRDPTPVPAGIHSNLITAAPDLVQVKSPTTLITGDVSSSSPDSKAINLGGYVPGGGVRTAAPRLNLPPIPIVTTVRAHLGGSAVPPPTPGTVVPGYSTLPLLGKVTLTHADGPEYSHHGDLSITGDLVLRGATLYVDGNLTVNGSIVGNGTVWVSGESSLEGTSDITSATPDRVALYSQGPVTLRGFDGEKAMADYSVNPEVRDSWKTVRNALAGYPGELDKVSGPGDLGPKSPFDLDSSGRVKIGSGLGAALRKDKGAAGHLVVKSKSHHYDSVPGGALLMTFPQSSARDFLVRRFFALYELNYGTRDDSPEELAALAEARVGRLTRGGVDAINDHYLEDQIPLIRGMVEGVDFNHPGQAYFQGQVYTHGYIYAENEIAIIGAVVTATDPSNPPPAPRTIGGLTLEAGDLVLRNGCRLLYVEEFFKPPVVVDSTSSGAELLVWCAR